MTSNGKGSPVWVLAPGPNGEVHYAINYVGGPVQTTCSMSLPPTYMYAEHDRPDGAVVCSACMSAFNVIMATRFRVADKLVINDIVVIDDANRRVLDVTGDSYDPDMVTITHVAPDDPTDHKERRCARNHAFERVGTFGFISMS